MKDSTDRKTNLEPPPPPKKGWLVDALETSADTQRRLGEIQVRNAAAEARRDQLIRNLSATFFVLFVLACTYGLALGCLALWNAVVG